METKAYEALKKMKTEIFIHKDSKNLVSTYDKWASEYEEDIEAIGYRIHDESAEVLLRYLSQSTAKSRVADLLSGTGLVGFYLRKRGYVGILHCVDGSQEMMKKAKSKGVYQELHQKMLEPGKDIFEGRDGTYDGVILVGGFLQGHLNPSLLPKMANLLKPGGYLVYTARVSEDNEHYRLPLETEAKQLLDEKSIKEIEIVKTSYGVDWNVENYNAKNLDKSTPSPVYIYCYKKL